MRKADTKREMQMREGTRASKETNNPTTEQSSHGELVLGWCQQPPKAKTKADIGL